MSKKKKLVVCAAAVLLMIVWYFVFIYFFNRNFPERYVADTYPDAKILSTDRGESIESQKGKLTFHCRESNGMNFIVSFGGEKNNRLRPMTVTMDTHEEMDKRYNRELVLINEVANHFEADDYFCVHNPFNPEGLGEVEGALIVINSTSAEKINKLMLSLDSKMIGENYQNIYYNIIVCSDGIFKKLQQIDWDKINIDKIRQCTFDDIAALQNWKSECLTSEDIRYSVDKYYFPQIGKTADKDADTVVSIFSEYDEGEGLHKQMAFGVNS